MIALALACAPEPPWADEIVSAPGADPSAAFGDPAAATNGARGGGLRSGGTDVYSLDLDGPRTELVLGFSAHRIIDGDGPDFVVFENAFEIAGGGNFMDPVIVEVSDDGEVFFEFPHTFAGTAYDTDPDTWTGFAGIHPVLHDADDRRTPAVDDPEAGGDRFDLADVGLAEATHIRLRPASEFPADRVSDGPDIDAVYAIHHEQSR